MARSSNWPPSSSPRPRLYYFGTYKMVPGGESLLVVEGTYDNEHAWKVVAAAIEDYEEVFCR